MNNQQYPYNYQQQAQPQTQNPNFYYAQQQYIMKNQPMTKGQGTAIIVLLVLIALPTIIGSFLMMTLLAALSTLAG